MRIKIQQTRDALHPSEVVVVFETAEGAESLVVDRASLVGGSLEVGQPLGADGKNLLIELPRETNRGAWRVWVPEANVVSQAA